MTVTELIDCLNDLAKQPGAATAQVFFKAGHRQEPMMGWVFLELEREEVVGVERGEPVYGHWPCPTMRAVIS